MQKLFIHWSQFKKYIRNHPSLFRVFKFLSELPVMRSVNKRLSPPTERFDKERGDAEFEYVHEYSTIVIKNITNYQKSDKSLLDIGCGYGYVTEMIAQIDSVARIMAIDKIEPRKFRIHHPKIYYEQHDICELSLSKNSFPLFNVVISTEFIEHISENDAKNLLFWIHSHLTPGGLFTGSTPINNTELSQFSGSPFHIREYSVKDFIHLLEHAGFYDISIEPRQGFFAWKAYK